MNAAASTAFGAAQTVQIQRNRVAALVKPRPDLAECIGRAIGHLDAAANALLGLSRELAAEPAREDG